MAKENLADAVITEIPPDEKILKEGIMVTMQLYGKRYRFPYKFALTEKGVWTRSKKSLFFKPKTTFMPYSHVKYYQTGAYNSTPCCFFHPVSGRIGNRVFFDDHEGAVKILDMFLIKKEGSE